ncbi:MAG TPA: diacylglycerol kinase family protein [Candidatus Saccharimonadales bacterium]
MHILVIYNKEAAAHLSELQQAFSIHRQSAVFKPLSGSIKKYIKQAVRSGCECVVAAGGDGTVNAVASELMQYKSVALGVLPMGTLNHFAKDIGMPTELRAAVTVIAQNERKKIDIAQVGDHYFLNNASFGVYPMLVKKREDSQEKVGKWPALLWAFLKIVPRLRRYRVHITCDHIQKTYRTPLVLVANNPYDIRKRDFIRRKTLTSGLLVVYVLETKNLPELLLVSWRVIRGFVEPSRIFTHIKAHEITLERASGKSLLLAYDGEVVSLPQASVSFRILPRKLQIITPKREDHASEN